MQAEKQEEGDASLLGEGATQSYKGKKGPWTEATDHTKQTQQTAGEVGSLEEWQWQLAAAVPAKRAGHGGRWNEPTRGCAA